MRRISVKEKLHEDIRDVLEYGMIHNENFRKVEEKTQPEYDATDYSHEDHILMKKASDLARNFEERVKDY